MVTNSYWVQTAGMVLAVGPTMKLGIASRIEVSDVDLADTVDMNLHYSDVVTLIDLGYGDIADAWLSSLSDDDK